MQSRDTANRAFTLIEVLIVIAIFAIILVSISTVLFGAIRLRDKTTEAVEAVLPADRAVAIMKQDLAGILPPGNLAGIMSSDTTVAGMGQPVALEIYTTTGTLKDDAPWGEVQKIDYWLQSPTNINRAPAGQELVRGVTRNLLATDTETPQPQSLIQGVQSLQFEYFDGTNWNNSWSSTLSNIPVAIKVSIDFASSKTDPQLRVPIQFLVPVVMQSSTNLTQSEN